MAIHIEQPSTHTLGWSVFRDIEGGSEEYLHKDGTWHETTDDDYGNNSFPGVFAHDSGAYQALSLAAGFAEQLEQLPLADELRAKVIEANYGWMLSTFKAEIPPTEIKMEMVEMEA